MMHLKRNVLVVMVMVVVFVMVIDTKAAKKKTNHRPKRADKMSQLLARDKKALLGSFEFALDLVKNKNRNSTVSNLPEEKRIALVDNLERATYVMKERTDPAMYMHDIIHAIYTVCSEFKKCCPRMDELFCLYWGY